MIPDMIPDWLVKGARVQLNPDMVREEWLLAWIGSIGIVERIAPWMQLPIVVSFEGIEAWYHFRAEELFPAGEIPPPTLPETVTITRAEYENLQKKNQLLEQALIKAMFHLEHLKTDSQAKWWLLIDHIASEALDFK